MPDLQLPPSRYRWRRPLSLPLAWFFVAVGALLLVWIFFNRTHTDVEFYLTVFLSFCVGGLVAGIMRNID